MQSARCTQRSQRLGCAGSGLNTQQTKKVFEKARAGQGAGIVVGRERATEAVTGHARSLSMTGPQGAPSAERRGEPAGDRTDVDKVAVPLAKGACC
jgi:hypothetical protein